MPKLEFSFPVWTDFALDKYIAPELSQLTVCGADDLPEPSRALGAYLLNCIFQVNFKDHQRAFAINYIRRAEQAVREYKIGRVVLLELIDKKNEKPTLYYQCLHHFEQAIALFYQAIILAHKHVKTIGGPIQDVFEKGSGSREERLNIIYNDWKHSYERIEQGKLPTNGTVPIWITNEGMKSAKTTLLFSELRDLLIEFEGLAKWLAEDMPKAIVECQRGTFLTLSS